MPKKLNLDSEIIELVNQKKSGRQISSILGIDYSTVHRKLRKLGINLPNYHNQLKFNQNIFDQIDTEEKAYWLGFLYADGGVYIQKIKNRSIYRLELSLKEDDIDHLRKFNTFMQHQQDNVKLSDSSCNGKKFKRCRWRVTNKHIVETLIGYGCTPRKSLTLKFPDISIFKDRSLIKDFVRGYIDGDGSLRVIYHKIIPPSLNISIIGTYEFLEEVRNLFNLEISSFKKDKRRPLSNTFYFALYGQKALDFANTIYQDSSIYLQRKYNIYNFAVSQSNL